MVKLKISPRLSIYKKKKLLRERHTNILQVAVKITQMKRQETTQKTKEYNKLALPKTESYPQ